MPFFGDRVDGRFERVLDDVVGSVGRVAGEEPGQSWREGLGESYEIGGCCHCSLACSEESGGGMWRDVWKGVEIKVGYST